MKSYEVTFGTSSKLYKYNSRLDLLKGHTYFIIADDTTSYRTPVTVEKISCRRASNVREITSAQLVKAPARPQSLIKRVEFNKEKGATTVLWEDGDVTVLKCNPQEEWDSEKALGLCFMKKAYQNRGCYYEEIKKWCKE